MGVQLPSEPITRKEQYLAKAAGQAVEVPAEPITREEAYLNAIAQGGGGGGTSDYESLSNQPQINGETLIGNKTGAELGLVDAVEGKGLSTNDYDDNEKAAVAAATSAISAMKDGTDLDSFGDVEVALLDKADTADLGTAATKDSTNSVTSGSTDLVESGAVKDAIDAAVSAAYHHAGTKTVAQLTHDLLIAANEGNVYNITDSGTTTSDFIEGIGKTIDEGSNVGICKVGNTYMFDLLSGFVDTSNFVQKSVTAGLLKNDGTVNDEIEGDVSALKSVLTDLSDHVDGDATTYPYADVITVSDAIPANLNACSVKVEPVQDLHGYDKPWPAGGGKNKLPMTVDSIKALNTSGTWSGNTYTLNGVTFTVQIDSDGNIIGIKANGTATNNILYFRLATNVTVDTPLIFSTNNTDTWEINGHVMEMAKGQITFKPSVISGIEITAGTYELHIAVANNRKIDNIYKPMLRLTTVEDYSFAPYTNICPISGHTEAVVTRDGKNWFNKNAVGIVVGKYLNSETGELVNSTNNWNTSEYIYVGGLGGESITFSGLNSIGASNFSVCYYDKNNSFVSGTNGKVMTLTIPSDERIAYLRFDYRQVDVDDVQLELGSIATPYEPYKGQQYTIQLGDTIYGGTVDFDSGVMTVNRAIVDMGTLAWTQASTAQTGKKSFSSTGISDSVKRPTSIQEVANIICSNTEAIESDSIYDCHNGVAVSVSGVLYYYGETYSTMNTSDFTTAVTGQTLCYELATPITVQLTPQQIQLLQGTNTLYADTGDISVTVNGVSGAIGAVQTQANATDNALAQLAADIAEQLPDAPTTDGTYVLTVTVADGAATYSWESAE